MSPLATHVKSTVTEAQHERISPLSTTSWRDDPIKTALEAKEMIGPDTVNGKAVEDILKYTPLALIEAHISQTFPYTSIDRIYKDEAGVNVISVDPREIGNSNRKVVTPTGVFHFEVFSENVSDSSRSEFARNATALLMGGDNILHNRPYSMSMEKLPLAGEIPEAAFRAFMETMELSPEDMKTIIVKYSPHLSLRMVRQLEEPSYADTDQFKTGVVARVQEALETISIA